MRYRQVKELCNTNNFSPVVRKYNTVTIYVGCASVLGMVIVANFQETNAFVVHIIGAQLCFGGGVIWQLLQVCPKILFMFYKLKQD